MKPTSPILMCACGHVRSVHVVALEPVARPCLVDRCKCSGFDLADHQAAALEACRPTQNPNALADHRDGISRRTA